MGSEERVSEGTDMASGTEAVTRDRGRDHPHPRLPSSWHRCERWTVRKTNRKTWIYLKSGLGEGSTETPGL